MGWKQDPNDNSKMVPEVITGSYSYDRATAPEADTEVERPDYVIINAGHATKYEFKYIEGGPFVDYGIVPIASNAGVGGFRVDIQPVAWKGGAGTTGHVTFIYKGDI